MPILTSNISKPVTDEGTVHGSVPSLLAVEGLSKSFGAKKAVDHISFTIGEGRCVALLGPNGAGKTTTIRMLTGLLAPTTGTISFPGLADGIDRRQIIGYLPQVPAFYGWMTGREFLLYSAKLCGLSGKEADLLCDSMLQRVGIADAAKRRIGGYSGGMKQRLGLAQALIHRPKLLILDEPVSALDPIGRREVMELLSELKQETTVLFSTHVLHDAEELCDDVLIMRSGHIAISGSMNSLRNQHRQSVLFIETEGDPKSKEWLARWLKQPPKFIQSSVLLMNGNGAKLLVNDIDSARRDILAQVLSAEVQVTRLEFGYSTLEDLFMRVVSES
ncbi:putative ABC transporter ATP-binding protein YxlF [Paenibacillus baekrokdamisoli]|uniref:Putative ABC transporter ATP-binding protein YxlF n=1 Tax=Paenibacillus baekrokdamisoli TaxID=1712516 RepID=A0A3G9J0J0_9BACL|nr:ABC transporter ATP-binding protein [Paenibacillus baekrokdamisoli]MBB3071284.1 ABC-2 type transport system ATP-binding protein [Paenibacillus baekrokdamisoli]BBH24680.1 putative ABC transporter ATP-binding protein YxlF [Paenibacillus baekrokdamisoli]